MRAKRKPGEMRSEVEILRDIVRAQDQLLMALYAGHDDKPHERRVARLNDELDGWEVAQKWKRTIGAPRPPDEMVDAIQDRIHPASGRLLHASPVLPGRKDEPK